MAYPIDFNFELAVEADERFLAAVVHMRRSLIAFVRVEPPVSDNEVGHRVGILATTVEAGILLFVLCLLPAAFGHRLARS